MDARDALAKSIYSCLFDWLVEQINKSLGVGKRRTGRSISILDIYGFESFDVCFFSCVFYFPSFCLAYCPLYWSCVCYVSEEQLWAVLHQLRKWETPAALQSPFIQIRARGKFSLEFDILYEPIDGKTSFFKFFFGTRAFPTSLFFSVFPVSELINIASVYH